METKRLGLETVGDWEGEGEGDRERAREREGGDKEVRRCRETEVPGSLTRELNRGSLTMQLEM